MTVTIKCNQKVTWERIQDLLICALEGGSNYWYMIHDHNVGFIKKEFPREEIYLSTVATYPGGYIIIDDSEGAPTDQSELDSPICLDRILLEKGLQTMADKYPRHFDDFIKENDDASTGDVFLQCCVFGEAIYG